jgi:hypothetical protein
MWRFNANTQLGILAKLPHVQFCKTEKQLATRGRRHSRHIPCAVDASDEIALSMSDIEIFQQLRTT